MSDRLERLQNHANALEIQLATAEGSAYASLSARYMDCLKQVEELSGEAAKSEPKGTPLDELEKRRSARKPSTSSDSSASR